jgi:hypothetical protein
MDVATTKLELVKLLLNTSDKGIIEHIKAVFNTQSEAWWEELPDEIQKSVIRGVQQSDKGQTITHEEAMKPYKKWLKK